MSRPGRPSSLWHNVQLDVTSKGSSNQENLSTKGQGPVSHRKLSEFSKFRSRMPIQTALYATTGHSIQTALRYADITVALPQISEYLIPLLVGTRLLFVGRASYWPA